MPKEKESQPTRQLYAKIREDVYLDAKAKSAELRVSMREFIENALIGALSEEPPPPVETKTVDSQVRSSVLDDVYLDVRASSAEFRLPLREFIENALISALSGEPPPPVDMKTARHTQRSVWDDEYLSMQNRQPMGSRVELTSEEAAAILRDALMNPQGNESAG